VKLVAESLEDILKPKRKEEVQPYIDKAIERTEALLSYVEDEIDFLQSTRSKVEEEEWVERYQNVHNKILEAEYEIPEYLRDKYTDRIHDLHTQIDALIGVKRPPQMNPNYEYPPINEQKQLDLSAGFVIIQDNKILLEHPTGNKWYGTYSFPKGRIEEGEDFLEAALRETEEEIGYPVNPKDVVSGPHFIDYTDKKDKLYKRVYYYVVKPSQPISNKDFSLQEEEVDWAGFLTKEDANKRILWRLKEVLKYLK